MAEVIEDEVVNLTITPPKATNGSGGGELETYYNYLKQKGADVPPTYKSFHATLQNETEAKKYYDYVKSKGYDAPETFESFSNTLGLKKKENSTPQVSGQGSKTIVSPLKSGGQSDQDFSPVDALLGGKKPEEQLGALGLPVMGDENKPKQDLFVPPTKGFQEVSTTTQNLPLKELNESQMVSLKEPLIQEGLAKLKLNPNDEDAKYQIAEGYRKNGIDRGAEFYYNDILKTNPANTKALQGIAYVSQQKGDYATALDNYKKVAAIEPQNVNVANGIAFNAFKTGNLEEAKAVNDAVLASDPKQPNALFTKSLIQNNDGDKEGADKTLTEATDQWILSQEAPSLVNQAYMDYLTNGGAETFRSQIDPFAGTPVEAAAHTLWEGGKNLTQGLSRMYGNGYNTPESHLGMFQALQGGVETAFGVGMSTPAGMEFIVGLEAADVFTNDYASKILMTPIDVFLPPPTDENGMNTEDELTQRKRALGNAAVSLLALHLAKPAIKTTVKKISDAVPEYSKEQIAKAKEKWDNGEEMNGEEIKQLHQAISSELTPENLKQLSKVTETIPEGTKNVSEVSGKLAAIEPETLAKIPTEISPEKKIEVAPLVEEKTTLEAKKTELEASKEKVDDSFHEGIDAEIKVVDESIEAKKKEINEKIKGSGLQVRNVKLKAEAPKELSFDEQRKKANEEFGVALDKINQADPKATRDESGEMLTNERKLKTLTDVYEDYRAKLKEIDRQEELSSQSKTENDAIQIEKPTESVLRDEGIRRESELQGLEQDNQPKVTTKESVKEEVVDDMKSNWDMRGEGDLLSGKSGELGYTQRLLPEWNRASQRGEINPDSKITYKSDGNEVIAYDENNTPIGKIKISTLAGSGKNGIEHLVVAPEFRRKGVATQLLKQLKEDHPYLDINKTELRSENFVDFINAKEKSTPKEEIISPKTETNVIKEKGTDSTTQKAEEVIPSEQGGEKVVAPTSETEGGKMTGITHEQTNEIARELGFEEYKEKPETIAEWDKEADKRISEGYNIEKLVSDMESGKQPDKIEQRIIAKYVANLKAQVEKAPTDANILELKRVVDTSNISGGREVAKSLRARVGEHPIDDSLAGFFLREMDVNKDAPLTESQKSRVVKEHADITEAQKKYDAKIATLEAENSKLRAEAELKKTKATTKKTKKTKDDFVAERKSLIEQFREEGKFDKNKPQAQGISLTNKQVEIIGKLVKSYVEEGISRLEDVVTKIAGELGLEKKDVHDVLAGEYNPKKKTRSEIAATIVDLKEQARLTNKLDALLRGEIPKNEKQKIQRNQEIEGLRKQIKDLQKEKADAERKIIEDKKAEEKAVKDAEKLAEKEELNAQKSAQKQAEKEAREKERIANQKTPEEQALANLKKRYAGEIKNLEEQIRTGDFSKPSDKPKLKLDKEAIKLKDELVRLKTEREVRLIKQEYQSRTKWQRGKSGLVDILNIPRTIRSSMDFSAPLRQGAIVSFAHPITSLKAAKEMFAQAWSQKRFDRWFYDVRQSDRFKIMDEAGLYVADPHDPRLTAKEEAFMNNLAEKIPFIGGAVKIPKSVPIIGGAKVGGLIKGSERAYVGYLNKMRVDLFNRFVDKLERDGKTFENSPEVYKALADYINNSTGRGKINAIESAAPILNALFFSPRLIASRINLLNPVYYAKLPKEVRIEAAKDMAKFIGIGMAVLTLAQMNGAEVELDPRSSDFGKIQVGKTRYDIWGGFQQYIRAFSQVLMGEAKSTASGQIRELDGKGAFGESRATVAGKFARGKLAPIPSSILNLTAGADIGGSPSTIGGELKSFITPLIIDDMREAMKDQGISSLFRVGLPATFGIGVQTYIPKGFEDQDMADPTIKFLYNKNVKLSTPEQSDDLIDVEYEKFVPLQKEYLKKEWDNIVKYGAMFNEDGNPTIDEDASVKLKPVEQLTYDELTKLMKSASNSATRKAKKEVLPNDDEKENHTIKKATSGIKKIQQK